MVDSHPLAAHFLAAHAAGGEGVAFDTLERRLRQLLEVARATHPTVPVSDERYLEYLAARVQDLDALERLHAADLFLACACADGDAAAIGELERAFLAPLPAIVTRGGIAADLAEESVQALRERLFLGRVTTATGGERRRAVITEYDGRGALAAWLRVSAVRGASNHRRDAARRDAIVAEQSPANLPVIDPALQLIRRQYGEVFHAAIRDAFAAIDPDERTVLRLHYTDGLNLDGIARILGISRATAGRRMLGARTHVREETLRLLGARIEATPAELESLLAVVRSTLELSLGALVADGPAT